MQPEQLNLVLNVLGAVFGAGSLGVVLTFAWRWRGLRNADEANIRDHYAKEVTALREAIAAKDEHFVKMEGHWRKMLEESDRRHEECETARHEQRREMNAVHSEMDGLKRQVAQYSADRLTILEGSGKPSEVAPHAAASAERVRDITGRGDDD